MIQCETIVDAYNFLVRQCRLGHRQDIQRGSFEGTETFRMQAKPLMIEISDPSNFVYLPKSVTVGMIEKYYAQYVMSDEVQENEEYSYGERIHSQLTESFEMLRKTPYTNQASITISQPSDIYLKNPPCLREITFSYFEDRLHLTSYWRSNDISEAFLLNQGSMSMFLTEAANYGDLKTGSLFYCSPGAHVYNY